MMVEELREAGLLDGSPEPHLTEKGRDWLRLLGECETDEVTDSAEAAAELVLSTNGLFR